MPTQVYTLGMDRLTLVEKGSGQGDHFVAVLQGRTARAIVPTGVVEGEVARVGACCHAPSCCDVPGFVVVKRERGGAGRGGADGHDGEEYGREAVKGHHESECCHVDDGFWGK